MKFDGFKSIRMSRPRAVVMHGVTIRKLPCGAYLDMLETMGTVVETCMEAAFPGKRLMEVLQVMQHVTPSELKAVGLRLMTVVPEQMFRILSQLLDTPADYLRNSLTPYELLQVVERFARENSYRDFFDTARQLLQETRLTGLTDLSSNGSQQG